jgi:putative addiction module component (TIGR02574 family)
MSVRDFFDSALILPQMDRIELTNRLWDAMSGEDMLVNTHPDWIEELERRIADSDVGKGKLLDSDVVIGRIRRKQLKQRTKIIRDFARWTALSALRSGSPIKSRSDVFALVNAVEFGVVLDSFFPISADDFDQWHESATTHLHHDYDASIGWATKVINVYLKTACYIGDLGRPGLREAIHPPIDSGLRAAIRRRFRDRPDIVDDVCCVNTIKHIDDYAKYRRIIRGCRLAARSLGCSLIEVEQLWMESDDLRNDDE